MDKFYQEIHSQRFGEATAATNPSYSEINAAINDLSSRCKIPAIIIKALVYQESSWRQFDDTSAPLISPDNGIGLTQVTVSDPNNNFETKTLGSIVPGIQGDNPFAIETSPVAVDINLLKTDWRYNLEIGCRILLAKKVASASEGDDAMLLENWWYTLAYYNGFVAGGANDPANPIYSRTVSENWRWLSIQRFPYQECVFNIVAQLYQLPIDLVPYFEPRAKVTLAGPAAVNSGAGHYDYVDASFSGGKSITYYKDNRAVVDGQTFNNVTVHWVEFGGPTSTPTVPFFSQRDDRWKNDIMGPGGCKVGDKGCAMTDVAMLLKYYGSDADPGKLNTWLCNNGGYNNNCEIIWGTAANYDGPGGMTYIGGNDAWDNWSELDNQLSQGYPVIVKVDFYPDTPPIDQHWVLVTHRSGGGGNPSSYYINDPWDLSYTEKTLAAYYDPVYDNTFFAMRIYHGTPQAPDTTPPTGRITSPIDGICTNSNSIQIEAEASDPPPNPSGVNYVRFYLTCSQQGNNGDWTFDSPWYYYDDYSSPYSARWDMSGIPDQSLTLTIWVVDKAGNIAKEPGGRVQVTVDRTPPTGSITSPHDGETITVDDVYINANASDPSPGCGVDYVRFYLICSQQGNNSDWTFADGWYYYEDYSSPYAASWDMRGIPDQSLTLTIWVVDKAGNIAKEPGGRITVHVNRVPLQPDLIVQNPQVTSSGPYYLGSSLSVSCVIKNQGQGTAGSSKVEYYLSTSSNGTDYYLGYDSVGSLNPGGTSSESETVTIPSVTCDKNYYVVFYADADGQVEESDETNTKTTLAQYMSNVHNMPRQ